MELKETLRMAINLFNDLLSTGKGFRSITNSIISILVMISLSYSALIIFTNDTSYANQSAAILQYAITLYIISLLKMAFYDVPIKHEQPAIPHLLNTATIFITTIMINMITTVIPALSNLATLFDTPTILSTYSLIIVSFLSFDLLAVLIVAEKAAKAELYIEEDTLNSCQSCKNFKEKAD